MTARVTNLRAIEVGVCNLEEATRFYTEVWGLREVAGDNKARYFRATRPFHHVLALHAAPRPSVVRIVLEAPDRDAVDALHGRVSAAGAGPVEAPAAWTQPGGGYGFGFKDPEGRNFAVVAGVQDHTDGEDVPDRPRRLGHVNINADQSDATCDFLIDVLGFKLSDTTRMLRFLRCNEYHSSIVLGFSGGPTLNHVAYEMPDLDSLMRGVGRMKDNGYPIEWGVGRHGPGNNIFSYFCGPEEFPIEYAFDTLLVDFETHGPMGPDHWQWPPGRADRWGVTAPHSARFRRIQRLFRFTEDGYKTRA